MTEERPLPDANLPPFDGGRSLMLGGAIAGAAGLLLTLLGGRAALWSYLIAFSYWLGLSLGALALVMANNTAGARWNVVVRRLGETLASTVPLFVILFIPLLLGGKQIWFWMDPPQGLPKETVELMAFVRRLRQHHALVIGNATRHYPLIFRVDPLNGINTAGETRYFFQPDDFF